MAGVNDCIDECSLQENGSGLLQVRLAPGGGLQCSNGLSVVPVAATFIPHYHAASAGVEPTAGAILTGILAPTTPPGTAAPVSSVMSGALSGPVGPGAYYAQVRAYSNMTVLPPASGDSACSLVLSASVDGVNYEAVHNVSYESIGGRPAFHSWQRTLAVPLAGGVTFVPTFVITYLRSATAGDDADFLKATFMQYEIEIHRRDA